jgi:hypothetical protein
MAVPRAPSAQAGRPMPGVPPPTPRMAMQIIGLRELWNRGGPTLELVLQYIDRPLHGIDCVAQLLKPPGDVRIHWRISFNPKVSARLSRKIFRTKTVALRRIRSQLPVKQILKVNADFPLKV